MHVYESMVSNVAVTSQCCSHYGCLRQHYQSSHLLQCVHTEQYYMHDHFSILLNYILLASQFIYICIKERITTNLSTALASSISV